MANDKKRRVCFDFAETSYQLLGSFQALLGLKTKGDVVTLGLDALSDKLSDTKRPDTLVLDAFVELYTSRTKEILEALARVSKNLRSGQNVETMKLLADMVSNNEKLFNNVTDNLRLFSK